MSPTQTPLEQLLRLFALETVAPDHFIGQSLDLGFRNLFGGHILGQSLVAAGNTCEERSAHSLHAYFIRGGDPLVPIHYKVERVRDGGTFSVRRVVASQSDKPILILSSSFQAEEEGFEHQATMPDVPEPESLAPAAKSQPPDSEPTGAQTGGSNMPDLAIEIRPISPIDRYHPDKREPSQHIWFRAAGPVVGNPALHRSLLAYASDFSLLGTCLRPHGMTYYQPDMVIASLDHAMWFYQDFRVDDWLLYACESPVAGQARGLNHGNIFSRDGKLVACVTQEGLIRRLSKN